MPDTSNSPWKIISESFQRPNFFAARPGWCSFLIWFRQNSGAHFLMPPRLTDCNYSLSVQYLRHSSLALGVLPAQARLNMEEGWETREGCKQEGLFDAPSGLRRDT